jgi:hypothetical protein
MFLIGCASAMLPKSWQVPHTFTRNGIPSLISSSHIQEASLADITYLFESGALIDFTPDELVHLILALFSDTPIRRDTIAKIIASRHMAA